MSTYRLHRLPSPKLALFILAILSPLASAQTVHYSSGGFEAPTFSPGPLAGDTMWNGQDGWLATGDGSNDPDLSKITVQTQLVHSGSQAVRIDATNQPTPYMHLRRNVPFTIDSSEPFLDIRLDMYIATPATTPSEWAFQAQSGPGSGILEWWIDTGDVIHMTDVGGDVDTGFVFTRDQWHNVITRLDYNAQTFEVLIDGLSVGTVNGHSGMTHWWHAFTSVMFSSPGDDQMYFDNFDLVTHDGQPGNFISFCFGDGSATACPCGNNGGTGEGCGNSTGRGAVLSALGSSSVSADNLSLHAEGLIPGQAALLFAGLNQLNGGSGVIFGDGLRCVGGAVKRLGVQIPGAPGSADWGPGLAASNGWSAGDVREFQTWYRDPSGGPCASGFNLSNGVEVQFGP